MNTGVQAVRKNAANIQGDLHTDGVMTDFSLALMNEDQTYVAGAAATLIPVQKQSDKFTVYDKGSFLRDEMQPRPLGGRPMQVGYKVGYNNYSVDELALEHFVDDRQRANADNQFNLDANAVRLLTTKSKIKRDRVWSQKFFKPGVWTFDIAGVASNPQAGQFLQFDQSGANPIAEVDEIREAMTQATGFVPNTLVLGSRVARRLRLNEDIVGRIQYTGIGIVTEAILASLFGVERVVVPQAVYNASEEGLADDLRFIVPADGMWMGYINPNAALNSQTAIGMFAWKGLFDGAANDQGGVIRRGRDDRASSDYFQIHDAWDMRVIAPDLGVFFSSVVGN